MNQLPAIAFKYHETFESIRSLRGVNRKLIAATCGCGLGSLALFYHVLAVTAKQQGRADPILMALSLGCGAIFLLLMFLVRNSRDQWAIREVMQITNNPRIASIQEARSALLSYLFQQPATSFLSTAEAVRKCVEFASLTNRPFSLRLEDLLRFIYHPDAKGRIVSLFLAATTLMAGMTLLNAEIREVGLEILMLNLHASIGLWIAAVFTCVVLYCMCTAVWALAGAVCDTFSRRSSNWSDINVALVRYVIRDLATYHVWPSPPVGKSFDWWPPVKRHTKILSAVDTGGNLGKSTRQNEHYMDGGEESNGIAEIKTASIQHQK